MDILGFGIGLDLGGSSSGLIIRGMALVRSFEDLVLVWGLKDFAGFVFCLDLVLVGVLLFDFFYL